MLDWILRKKKNQDGSHVLLRIKEMKLQKSFFRNTNMSNWVFNIDGIMLDTISN
jgi:hypothetical protein